ncbi:creatininase family protein [Reyranella sp.]|uniref:creatininase family protein n=1 Tax=Reyranella sp. TaxID=1929291 RepID=UPI0025EE9454|nr:creatininase family protein [Reyranella sp.]
MKGVWLEDLTWPEAKARFDRDDVVVIPVAAAIKPHGPYLPLGTDALIARALAQRVIERLPVVVAPMVDSGVALACTSLAGGQHRQSETFRQFLRDVVDGFGTQGVSRVALLGVGTSAEQLLDLDPVEGVLVLRAGGMGVPVKALIERLGDHPVGEVATSIMLALAPRSIRPEPSAGAGDPSHATAFKGERLMAAWVDDLVTTLTAKWPTLGM